jgi:hypothetical protein
LLTAEARGVNAFFAHSSVLDEREYAHSQGIRRLVAARWHKTQIMEACLKTRWCRQRAVVRISISLSAEISVGICDAEAKAALEVEATLNLQWS